jgi:hypothetical protein
MYNTHAPRSAQDHQVGLPTDSSNNGQHGLFAILLHTEDLSEDCYNFISPEIPPVWYLHLLLIALATVEIQNYRTRNLARVNSCAKNVYSIRESGFSVSNTVFVYYSTIRFL